MHFAVAPAGAAPLAALVVAAAGAVPFAAGAAAVVAAPDDRDRVPEVAGVADGAGVAGAAEEAVAADDDADFCTPPWPLHAPRPEVPEVVPSLHRVAPEDVLLEAWLAVAVDDDVVDGEASVDAPVDDGADFCTPP